MSKFEVLKERLGDWYSPLSLRITDDIYDEIYKAAQAYIKETCYPEPADIFKAFKMTPLEKVKVVILGQDPYHDGNATGLAFECKNYITPSMDSIQDAYQDYHKNHFQTDILEGDLSRWAQQGVLLLNTALTVEKGKPNSHKEYWSRFSVEVIKVLNKKNEPLVFMLWGGQAQSYEQYIDKRFHHVLKAEHPVAGKYSGRKWEHKDCFAKCNEILLNTIQNQIKW